MQLRDFICGYLAGFAQLISGQPFDLLKIRIQATTQKIKMTDLIRQVHTNHGFRGYYMGSSSLFISYGAIIAVQFLVYQWSKRTILKIKGIDFGKGQSYSDFTSKLTLLDIAIAGQVVGLATAFICCPVQYVKTQRQLNPHLHSSSIGLLYKQAKNHGLKSITKGMVATIARQLTGCSFFYGIYQETIRILSHNERNKANFSIFLTAGAAAGLVYTLISYPFDVIKTKVQNNMKYNDAFQELKIQKYKGISPALMKSIVVSSTGFLVYQECRKALDNYDNINLF